MEKGINEKLADSDSALMEFLVRTTCERTFSVLEVGWENEEDELSLTLNTLFYFIGNRMSEGCLDKSSNPKMDRFTH